MKKLALGSAIVAIMQGGIAQAQESKPCLTVVQAQALITYLLPKAVDAGRSKCGATLSPTSRLMANNSEQLARYKAASEEAWPMARKAVDVMAGDRLPPETDDALVRPIADAMFTQMIGKEIKPKHCATIDKVYSDLSPMPSANIASLAVTIIQAATEGDKDQDIPICKAPA